MRHPFIGKDFGINYLCTYVHTGLTTNLIGKIQAKFFTVVIDGKNVSRKKSKKPKMPQRRE